MCFPIVINTHRLSGPDVTGKLLIKQLPQLIYSSVRAHVDALLLSL